MSNDEKRDGYCNAQTRSGGYCGRKVSDPSDRCYMHGGATPTKDENPDVGAPEGSANAETHGLYAETEKWFARNRDEVEDDVKRLVQSWMEQAPFGWEQHGNVWLLVECAIDEVRMQQADDYVDEEGVIVEHYDGTDPISERPIIEKKENPALLPKSRMKKDTVRALKDFGIIGDSEDTTVNVNVQEEYFSGLKAVYEDDEE